MKKIRKITSLIMAIAIIATSFVWVSTNEALRAHAANPTAYNGAKYSLAMDTSSATQGQFSLVYASSHNELLGDAPSYPTANGDVLEVDGRQLFSVGSDVKEGGDECIHMDIPHSSAEYYAAVVFTAPVSGVYSFTLNVGLYRPGGGWNTDGGNWNNFRLYAAGYDKDADTALGTGAADNWPIIDHVLYNTGNGTGDTEVIVNKTVTMSAGDKIAFIPACGANGATDLVRQFDVTLDNIIYELKMDTSSATQGQFSFNYAAGNVVNAFADNANHPTADNGVLKVDEHNLFYVESGKIVANLPQSNDGDVETTTDYYAGIVFTAPVAGTYSFTVTANLQSKAEGGWNNHWIYAAGYDVSTDTDPFNGYSWVTTDDAAKDWPMQNYGLDTSAGMQSAYSISKTVMMTKGQKIAWIPTAGPGGAVDAISQFSVTLNETNCTSHIWGEDDICDDCGYSCETHTWEGDNACDVCGYICTAHVPGNDAACDVCGTVYTATITVDPTAIARTENTTVKVSSNMVYASGEISVKYNKTKFTFVGAYINGNADMVTDAQIADDVVTVATYGADKNTECFELVFAPIKDKLAIGEEVDFSLTAAAYSTSMAAETKDLLTANIGIATATTTIVAEKYEITISTPGEDGLADAIEAVDGNTVYATEEQAYELNLPANYQYYTWSVESTLGEATVEDGVITITGINAAATVTVTRTAISRNVIQLLVDYTGEEITDNGVIFGNNTAVFGTDYLAVTVPENSEPDNVTGTSGYAYEVKVYYTSDTERANALATSSASVAGGLSYTVSGSLVTEAITVVVTRTETGVTPFTVTVNGPDTNKSGANTVNEDQPFSFTLTVHTGFDYSVSAVDQDGGEVELTVGENGVYTIAEVNTNITVTVNRTVITTNVSVGNYVQLNGAMMYIVTITDTELDENCAYTYNGQTMFYNCKYDEGNGAYTFLVISENELSLDAAKASVNIVTDGSVTNARYNENEYDYDVNGSGKVDVNDAQLVWNIYEGKYYTDFSRVSMLKFLLADTNGSGNVNVDDATVIINQLYPSSQA